MGYDKLISFFTKNLQNYGIEEIFPSKENNRVIANHIFFDINFIIYSCTAIVEDEINEIIKLIFSLAYTDYDIIVDKLEKIIDQPHWNNIKINLKKTLDGTSQEQIINNFLNFLNESDDLSNIYKLLFWHILFKLEKMINEIHIASYIKSINVFFDGIPSYSKILEQRRRRVKNYIESSKRKQYFTKNFNKINKSTITEGDITFDYFNWLEYQFSFDKSMGPFSKSIILLNKFIEKNLIKLYPNKQIHVNSSINYGEADYKIFKYIKENKVDCEICIHSCDSDFIHLILIFQLLADIKSIDANYLFVRYYTKDDECYQLINAKKINSLLIDKYISINSLSSDINNNFLFDFLFIILMFGNDIIPLSFELSTELNLKILFETHYNLYKKSLFVVNINSSNIINFDNLKLWLTNIKDKHTFTIVCLNRFYKLPYYFTILCGERLNLNINGIVNKLIVPYLTYQGKELLDSLDEDDIRYIYYQKFVKNKSNNIDDLSNPLDTFKLDKNTREQLEQYMNTIFDYANINDYGLIKLDKSLNINNNLFQNLYNLVIIEASKESYLDFQKQYNINFDNIITLNKEYTKICKKSDTENYLKLLTNQAQILFNNFSLYTPYSFIFYKESIAPSLNQIITFIELNDMKSLQTSWIRENTPIAKELYFNEISHHLFITPYLIDSIYLKQIHYLDNIESILNVLDYLIEGIWYKDDKHFNLRDINPLLFIKTCNNIIELYQTKMMKDFTKRYLIQIKNMLIYKNKI